LTIRTRKLIGAIILFVLLACWVMLGLALAPVAFGTNSDLAGAVFYVVAGLGWLVIAMPLVRWMSRPNQASRGPDQAAPGPDQASRGSDQAP
jgi:Protein of unknown function (DUF2842)